MGSALTQTRDMQQAFSSFVRASEELSQFYKSLEDRVTDLSDELARTHNVRLFELAEKERLARRLQNLVNALPAGVIVLDGAGVIQEFNEVAVTLLGEFRQHELWRDVVTRAFSPRFDDGHDITLVTGRRVNIATQALDGEPGQIILVKDVTENRHLQDQLARHKRLSAKGEMAAALAHQIRTPLASALLHVSNLNRSDLKPEMRERFASSAIARLRHLESLVEDMLLLARGGNFDTTEVGFNELFEELQGAIDAQMADGEFITEIDSQLGGLSVRCNRDALVSAMQNLVINAQQACGGRGTLRITGRSCGEEAVTISFADDGPGIPEGIRESVFEPFVTAREQGSGLGLAVVQSVLDAHGGSASLDVDYRGGANFVIRLPIASVDTEGVEQSNPSVSAGAN